MTSNVHRLFDEPAAVAAPVGDFDALWLIWPRKDGKAVARVKYLAIIKGGYETRTLDKSSQTFIPMELRGGDAVMRTLATCPCCDGAGEWDEGPLPASSGATEPDYRQVTCAECNGTGRTFVDTEARTMEDIKAENDDGALDPDFLRDRQQDDEMNGWAE